MTNIKNMKLKLQVENSEEKNQKSKNRIKTIKFLIKSYIIKTCFAFLKLLELNKLANAIII